MATGALPVNALRLALPLPPGVNNQYVTVGKRRVLSKTAQTFRRDVAALIRERQTRENLDPWLATLRDQPFACDLVFYFETPFKRDLDGGLKIALDAVCECLGLDDRYIVALTLEKRIDPLRPRLELELGPVADWQFDREYVVLG
jgi:crossover junction endodeoxyribonuclease RusA